MTYCSKVWIIQGKHPIQTHQCLLLKCPFFANNTPYFYIPAQTSSFNPYRKTKTGSSEGVENNLFGSQTATLTRGEKLKKKADTQIEIVDALYELPGNLDLELGMG